MANVTRDPFEDAEVEEWTSFSREEGLNKVYAILPHSEIQFLAGIHYKVKEISASEPPKLVLTYAGDDQSDNPVFKYTDGNKNAVECPLPKDIVIEGGDKPHMICRNASKLHSLNIPGTAINCDQMSREHVTFHYNSAHGVFLMTPKNQNLGLIKGALQLGTQRQQNLAHAAQTMKGLDVEDKEADPEDILLTPGMTVQFHHEVPVYQVKTAHGGPKPELLLEIKGDSRGYPKTIQLSGKNASKTIGRGAGNNVNIDKSDIARLHANICWDEDAKAWCMTSLGNLRPAVHVAPGFFREMHDICAGLKPNNADEARAEIQEIDVLIGDMQKVRSGMNLVQGLEMATMVTPWDKRGGAYTEDSQQGYRDWLQAYRILYKEKLAPEHIAAFNRAIAAVETLGKDRAELRDIEAYTRFELGSAAAANVSKMLSYSLIHMAADAPQENIGVNIDQKTSGAMAKMIVDNLDKILTYKLLKAISDSIKEHANTDAIGELIEKAANGLAAMKAKELAALVAEEPDTLRPKELEQATSDLRADLKQHLEESKLTELKQRVADTLAPMLAERLLHVPANVMDKSTAGELATMDAEHLNRLHEKDLTALTPQSQAAIRAATLAAACHIPAPMRHSYENDMSALVAKQCKPLNEHPPQPSYIVSGFVGHHTVTVLEKVADPQTHAEEYIVTSYNAGGMAKNAPGEADKVMAMYKQKLLPGVKPETFVRLLNERKIRPTDSSYFMIDTLLESMMSPVFQHRAEKPQGKGNCTTRQTRGMLRDIFSPEIFDDVHRHVSNPEICDPSDAMAALQLRRAALEKYLSEHRQEPVPRPADQAEWRDPSVAEFVAGASQARHWAGHIENGVPQNARG